MSAIAAADLRDRLERDPDIVLLTNATDRVLSIGSDVWRMCWQNQLTTAVAADADLSTTCGALLDVLALLELEHAGLGNPQGSNLDLSAVNVIVNRPLPGESPSEIDEPLRSLRAAVVGVTARVWYQRGAEGWIEDDTEAPTWQPNDERITDWVNDLLIPRLTTEPTQLARAVLSAVDDPSLHLYPSEIRAGQSTHWALRIDGLEIGVVDRDHATLTVGRPGAAGDSSQRKAFVKVFGRASVTVKAESQETDVLDLRTAARKIHDLLKEFRGIEVRGAPITHRTKDGIPFVDEHALEARLLKGIVKAPGGEGLVGDDAEIARGSQFPTLWDHSGKPRYLDAVLTRGTTPLAVELKVATSGQGRYYRRALVQAVLYAHFIRNAPALHPWFETANLERSAVVPVVGIPTPLRATPDWNRRLESLRAVARRVGAEVWVLDDRVTPHREVAMDGDEPENTDLEVDLERESWRFAASLSRAWPRALGRTVDTWPLDGFYDMIELRHRDDDGLGLPVRVLRLQFPHLVGAVMDPVVPSTDPEEPITVTPAEIIYHRRVRVLEHAAETGSVTATCKTFGVSRTRFYEWRNVAEQYGLEALMPKERRAPQMPNATPTWVVNELLTLAVTEPTIGCRQYADRLAARGFGIGKSTVQDILVRHELGKRHQRVARTAAIAALTSGLNTEAVADDRLFGFCHWAAQPGDLVALDSFYIGNLKGVGKVYQLTAIDTATRWAFIAIVLGTPNGKVTARFLHQMIRRYRRLGVTVRAVLTDNGPEYRATTFTDALAAKELTHRRIPARSPNHNAVCERFQGTALQECWRPAFHRRRFSSTRQLQAEIDAWLIHYNTRRRNHSDFMRGRTPRQVLDTHRKNKAA